MNHLSKITATIPCVTTDATKKFHDKLLISPINVKNIALISMILFITDNKSFSAASGLTG